MDYVGDQIVRAQGLLQRHLEGSGMNRQHAQLRVQLAVLEGLLEALWDEALSGGVPIPADVDAAVAQLERCLQGFWGILT